MNRISKLLFVASIVLMLTGAGLAVARPGGLGDEDTAEVASPSDGSSTTVAPGSTVAPPADGVTTVAPPADGEGSTAGVTPIPDGPLPADLGGVDSGSSGNSDGLGTGVATPSDTDDGLADTGGASLLFLGAGAACAAGGAVVRRRLR